jgi:hypothetical protein
MTWSTVVAQTRSTFTISPAPRLHLQMVAEVEVEVEAEGGVPLCSLLPQVFQPHGHMTAAGCELSFDFDVIFRHFDLVII